MCLGWLRVRILGLRLGLGSGLVVPQRDYNSCTVSEGSKWLRHGGVSVRR